MARKNRNAKRVGKKQMSKKKLKKLLPLEFVLKARMSPCGPNEAGD